MKTFAKIAATLALLAFQAPAFAIELEIEKATEACSLILGLENEASYGLPTLDNVVGLSYQCDGGALKQIKVVPKGSTLTGSVLPMMKGYGLKLVTCTREWNGPRHLDKLQCIFERR